MSIAAMADVRLLRTEGKASTVPANDPKTKAGIPQGILNTLVQWIPSETLATYVAVQAVMPAVVVPANKEAHQADYSDRWILYFVMLVFSIVLVPLYTFIKSRSTTTQYQWPVLEMLVTAAAFTIWAVALVDSPFLDFSRFESWMQTLVIVAGGGLLAAITVALKASPAWSDNSKNDTPPSPHVT